MDVHFFLTDRLAFIRQFYENASRPFFEQQRKIEDGEAPFIPIYSEDDEPPYLNEWVEASESLQVLGYSCLSMLAAALHLYLETWTKQLVPVGGAFKKEFKKGWFNGYRAYFSVRLNIQFDQAPADLTLLEEVILARNRFQHAVTVHSWTSLT